MLLLPLAPKGQEILSSPHSRTLTRVPLRLFSGGITLIRAALHEGGDSLNFILDTGSSGISLDSTTCAEKGIPTTLTDTTLTGLAGSQKVRYAFQRELRLPGLTVPGLSFHIYDYSLLSAIYGERIDGVIGYSFFSRYIVRLDFEQQVMEVCSPGPFRYPAGGTLLHPSLNFIPVHPLTLSDQRRNRFPFYLDSGAGLCFLMSERYHTDSMVIPRKRTSFITQAEGVGGRKQMRLTVLRELRLGPYRFRQVPVYLFKDDNNVTAYPLTGGLIGSDLLRRFHLILNYPAREIHLRPNRFFAEPFDYGYTGLTLHWIAERILVEDIIPGSPAERAGFLTGDEIVGVNGDFSGQIQQYKDLLQDPARTNKVFIRRQGELRELVMSAISIR